MAIILPPTETGPPPFLTPHLPAINRTTISLFAVTTRSGKYPLQNPRSALAGITGALLQNCCDVLTRALREFKNGKIQGLINSGAYDFFETLKSKLSDYKYNVRDFSSKEDRAYDCGESNGFLGVLVNINGIDLIVLFSKSKKVKILIATTKSTLESLVIHKNLLNKAGFFYSEPKNLKVKGVGRYIDFVPKIEFSPEAIIDVTDWLNGIRNTLK